MKIGINITIDKSLKNHFIAYKNRIKQLFRYILYMRLYILIDGFNLLMGLKPFYIEEEYE